MEENAMFANYDQEAGAYADENAVVRQATCISMICPSSPNQPDDDQPSVSSYAGCHHDSEAPIDTNNNGLLFLNSRIRYSDIYDGSSHTILIGEVQADASSLGWVSGTRATLRNTGEFEPLVVNPYAPVQMAANDFADDDDETDAAANTAKELHVGGFGSYHNGDVVNFAFADGSVHTISQSIDKSVFRLLGNRSDGEIMPLF
jgi:prepilin-type processing-associated H-X9-DG protein